MSRNVIDKDLGLKRIIREMQKARNAIVEIGIFEDAKNKGESVAEYGAYNEFGTGNIHERSFMRSTFDENSQAISKDLELRYSQVQAGTITVHKALKMVGERHVGQIKLKIGSNIQPANSPATQKRKDRTAKVAGGSKTLIDTGIMRNSIRAVVGTR